MERETPHPPHGKCHKNIPIFLTLPLGQTTWKDNSDSEEAICNPLYGHKSVIIFIFFLNKVPADKKSS